MTRISNEERQEVVARFYEEVMGDLPVDEAFAARMRNSVPDLPDDPSQEQLDAWIELAEILSDRGFIDSMRAMTEKGWGGDERPDYDQDDYHQKYWQLMAEVGVLQERSVDPAASEADDLLDRFVALNAPMFGGAEPAEVRAKLLESYTTHDPRAARYWELVALMRGDRAGYEQTVKQNAAVAWILDALKARA